MAQPHMRTQRATVSANVPGRWSQAARAAGGLRSPRADVWSRTSKVIWRSMVQRFTLWTAVLNLLVWLVVLIGTVVGPLWLALAGWVGVLAVTGWTLLSTSRAGEDPFPDLRDRPEVREHQTLLERAP
jgi:hypothetical protein